MVTRKRNSLAAKEAQQAILDEAKPKVGRPKKPLAPGEKPKRRGRPPGSPSVRNNKFAQKIEAGKLVLWEAGQMLPDNVTPLDIMWAAARIAWATRGPFAAFEFAKECAPYVHARIASIQMAPPKPNQPADPRQATPLIEFVDPEVAEVLGLAQPEPPKEG